MNQHTPKQQPTTVFLVRGHHPVSAWRKACRNNKTCGVRIRIAGHMDPSRSWQEQDGWMYSSRAALLRTLRGLDPDLLIYGETTALGNIRLYLGS